MLGFNEQLRFQNGLVSGFMLWIYLCRLYNTSVHGIHATNNLGMMTTTLRYDHTAILHAVATCKLALLYISFIEMLPD